MASILITAIEIRFSRRMRDRMLDPPGLRCDTRPIPKVAILEVPSSTKRLESRSACIQMPDVRPVAVEATAEQVHSMRRSGRRSEASPVEAAAEFRVQTSRAWQHGVSEEERRQSRCV